MIVPGLNLIEKFSPETIVKEIMSRVVHLIKVINHRSHTDRLRNLLKPVSDRPGASLSGEQQGEPELRFRIGCGRVTSPGSRTSDFSVTRC